jgi:hypothetical protein
MFQFSNLLNRTEAERQRRRATFGPHSLAVTGGAEGCITADTTCDSLPERVRRELDEQMDRLTKLLDHVESLESDESSAVPIGTTPQIFRGEETESAAEADLENDAVKDSSELESSSDAVWILPLSTERGPNLDAVVLGLEAEVVSDLVFAASSADDSSIGTQCESISVHTEEIVPFPRRCITNPKAYRKQDATPRENPPRARANTPKTLATHRGVVQNFSFADSQTRDNSPTLEIFETELDSPATAVYEPEDSGKVNSSHPQFRHR